MPHEVKRFKCNHCKRTHARLYDAARHETICIYNPDQRACPSCLYDTESGCFKSLRPNGVAMIRNCETWCDFETEWPEQDSTIELLPPGTPDPRD